MTKGIFITGTGTDVGKTFVSALLLKKMRENKINVGYYKPVLSGAYIRDGKLIPGDVEYVCNISNLHHNPSSLVSYVFETAASPHLAAQIEKKKIEKQVILNDFNKISGKFEYMIVEGCGGIICPLRTDNETIMLTDIIKMLEIDIIIVASADLGTINTTVLTVEYAKQLGIRIRGIILNHYEKDNFLHKDNKKQIEILTGVSVLACVAKDAFDLEIDLEL